MCVQLSSWALIALPHSLNVTFWLDPDCIQVHVPPDILLLLPLVATCWYPVSVKPCHLLGLACMVLIDCAYTLQSIERSAQDKMVTAANSVSKSGSNIHSQRE